MHILNIYIVAELHSEKIYFFKFFYFFILYVYSFNVLHMYYEDVLQHLDSPVCSEHIVNCQQ